MVDFEKRIEQIQQGNLSGLVHNFLEDLVLSDKEDIILKLLNAYRSNRLTEVLMIGSIGELEALDRILKKIESRISRGEAASREVHAT